MAKQVVDNARGLNDSLDTEFDYWFGRLLKDYPIPFKMTKGDLISNLKEHGFVLYDNIYRHPNDDRSICLNGTESYITDNKHTSGAEEVIIDLAYERWFKLDMLLQNYYSQLKN